MIIKSADFVASNIDFRKCPAGDKPEYAFIGRSNVGKSSLINRLLERKNLARTSSTPGKTRLLNHFLVNGDWYLVDLPGYGYAEAPKPLVEKWQRLLKDYLSGRQTLRRAFVLIDTRHGVKAVDEEILTLLDRSAVTFQAVLTKADKVSRADREATLAQVRGALAKHPAAYPEVVVTSSEKGDGIETLRAIIATLE
jgi:GTP-binding protein